MIHSKILQTGDVTSSHVCSADCQHITTYMPRGPLGTGAMKDEWERRGNDLMPVE